MKKKNYTVECRNLEDLIEIYNHNLDIWDKRFRKLKRKTTRLSLVVGVLTIAEYMLLCWWYESKTYSKSGVKKEG